MEVRKEWGDKPTDKEKNMNLIIAGKSINIDNTKAFGETIAITAQDIANITVNVLKTTSVGEAAEFGSIVTVGGEILRWHVA